VRWALVGAVFFGAFAFLSGAAGARPVATPTRAQLQLMPLPKSAYGSEAASLKTEPRSGWRSNKQAAEKDLDPAMTADKVARRGRITGFEVEFDDLAKASRAGQLIDADNEVSLFRTKADATAYYTQQLAAFRRFAGKRARYGIVIDHLSFFPVPGLRGTQGFRYRIRANGITATETGAAIHLGVIVAFVGTGRTDARDVRTEVRRLAGAVNRRIHGVLAGKITDKPLS
jgi:hypothetical protein